VESELFYLLQRFNEKDSETTAKEIIAIWKR
jgi:hypothetical protein